jgi:mannose-6-phosphate isomerase-like protein (cupin superfamily)
MAALITEPTTVPAAGEPPKRIDEFVGQLNTGTSGVSIALMTSPSGWVEPGQRPEFDEYTLVLDGELLVESEGDRSLTVAAGQAVHVPPGEWVRYSSPGPDGARYVAVCLPAFNPDLVHRDE